MKYVLVVFALLLMVGACSKFDVYEENLQFMTRDTLAAEKAMADKRVETARASLAQAEASGDSVRIKAARERLSDAMDQVKAVANEEHRRGHHWIF